VNESRKAFNNSIAALSATIRIDVPGRQCLLLVSHFREVISALAYQRHHSAKSKDKNTGRKQFPHSFENLLVVLMVRPAMLSEAVLPVFPSSQKCWSLTGDDNLQRR
jgi:hypothetical protein